MTGNVFNEAGLGEAQSRAEGTRVRLRGVVGRAQHGLSAVEEFVISSAQKHVKKLVCDFFLNDHAFYTDIYKCNIKVLWYRLQNDNSVSDLHLV